MKPQCSEYESFVHLPVHAVPLNLLTFEDNIYLGHTEVCASVGVVWAYSEGLPLMGRQIVMENTV